MKNSNLYAATKLGPKDTTVKERTLWRAQLRIQTQNQEFLFRSTEDFDVASTTAMDLCDTSESCKMVGAELVGVTRIGHLWN
jgi:hypothetical protein